MKPAEKTQLLKMLRAGSSQKWACREVGFDYDTMCGYRERAARKEEPFASFIREVNQAQAGYVNERLRVLDADAVGAPLTGGRERGDGNIKWILERLHPRDFAPLHKNEHTGKDGAPLVPGETTPQAAAALMRVAFGGHARPAVDDDETEGKEDD